MSEGYAGVEKYMPLVKDAINRHVKDRDAFTDIYNRCYEAISAALTELSKGAEK